MDNSISDLFATNEIFDDFEVDSDFNHLRVIFEEVLCTVSFIDVEENIFCEEIPKLKEACDAVICKITELLHDNQIDVIDEIKTLIKRYNTLIKFATDAVKFVNKKVKLCQVQSLPLPICDILFNTFKHCRESNQLYGNHFAAVSVSLTDLFKRATELQSSFLHLVNNCITFELLEDRQTEVVIRLIETLSNIGEIITSLDIKSTAELWKGYLILTQTHINHVKSLINIEKPLQYFCKEIGESLVLLLSGNERDLKKIETSLKITSFNLKIVIKLCGLYDHLGNAYGDLFSLLIILNRYFIPYLHLKQIDGKIIDLMQVYVSVAAEPLLGCLISSREFIQYFLKNINCQLINDDTRLAATLLIISVLKKISFCDYESQQIWLHTDNFADFLRIIFEMLELLHVEFSIDLHVALPSKMGEKSKSASLYEYLLIHTVAVILISHEKHYKLIEKLLFESIIQTNIWRALFSSDIWCILARYGPEETCQQQLIFLIDVFLMLENGGKPELYFLKKLLNRLFQLLTYENKSEIVALYPPDKYHRLWICINIHENQINCQLIYNDLNSFINSVNSNNFNQMMKSLELIPTIKKPNEIVTNKISGILRKFWMISQKNLQNYWQFQFVWNLCKATKFLISYLNNKDLLTLLEFVATSSKSNKRMQLINCVILKSLATKSISPVPEQTAVFAKISQCFKLGLKDEHPVIKQTALEVFTFFAQHTIHESILSYVVDGDADLQQEISNYLQGIKCPPKISASDYFARQRCVKFRHECESFEPAAKKQKSCNELNVEAVLARMKHDADMLHEYFENKNISPSNAQHASYIVDKLRKFLQK